MFYPKIIDATFDNVLPLAKAKMPKFACMYPLRNHQINADHVYGNFHSD